MYRLHMPSFSQTQWTSCKRWSLEWAAPTGTQPCTVFGYKDFCGSTVLGMPESVGMTGRQTGKHSRHHIWSAAGRAEMLRGLRNFLNKDKLEHHSTDCLKERGVEKGSGQYSTLQGRQRSVFNQANIGTVSRATLGRLLRDGAERVWAFPSATMPPWAETETETNLLQWCQVQPYRSESKKLRKESFILDMFWLGKLQQINICLLWSILKCRQTLTVVFCIHGKQL